MNYRLILIFVLATLLPSCAPKLRADFNWEQYKESTSIDSLIVEVGFDQTWSALKEAGDELDLILITEEKASGILAYTKPDERFDNTAFELTLHATPVSSDRTEVNIHEFVFTTKYGNFNFRRVFPSKGELEKKFINAVNKHLKDSEVHMQ